MPDQDEHVYDVGNRLSLSWRTLPPADEVILLLQVLLTGADEKGFLEWQTADSRSEKAVRLAVVEAGLSDRRAVVQFKHTRRRHTKDEPV